MNTAARIEACKFLPLLRKFQQEWFPAKDVPTIIDFIIWLEDNGYRITEIKDAPM